jgi:hypothetical protein
MATACLTVNTRRVVHELVEGEVIIICLETGNYYQLTDLGAAAWSLIEQAPTREQIAQGVARMCGAEPGAVERQTATFIDDLLAEQIVVLETGANAPVKLQDPQPGEVLPLDSLRLSKFTNMSDLLLLDPIHDVDEQGWPHGRDQ